MRSLKPEEREERIDFYINDGMTLREIQEDFDRFINDKNVYPETVEIDRSWDGEDSNFFLIGIRDETPSEKQRRLDAERQRRVKAGERRKAKLEQERKEYERLKKKFGE